MSEDQGTYALTTSNTTHALVDVEQQRAIAETQGAMIIAKRFPRDVKTAIDRIQNACTRPGLAEAALYQYARGGTDITGPSIRLAEAIAQCWGNLQFGIRELDQRQGNSTVEAFAWDVETNTRQVKIFQVAHKRYTKKGAYALEDPRDIYEMVANQGARRLRACILGVIPGDVVESAVTQCEATMKTKAAVTPERITGTLEKFAEYGVTKEQIEARIQRRLEAMTPAQMVNLAKIFNSLKDGMSVAADWFQMPKVEGTIPKQEITTEDKPGPAVYEFKEEKKVEPAPAQAPQEQKKDEPEAEIQKAEEKPQIIPALMSEIKKTRPKAGSEAMGAFKKLYFDNRDLILSLTGPDFDYAKGKWTNAGLSWEKDFLGANSVQAVTSPEKEGNGSKDVDKAQDPGIVDFGEEEKEPEQKEETDPRALLRHKIKQCAGELKAGSWEALVNYFRGWDTEGATVEFLQGMLTRCQSSLDKQNAVK